MSDTAGKFYLTTPIYYVNDQPHIGHAYTSVVADVLARYWRLRGREVMFLTGTDENSQKNVEAAKKRGYQEIQPYLDMMSGVWRQTFTEIGLTFDDFIRTTEPRHKTAVEKFWRAVKERHPDHIYQGEYEGLYCEGCEAFVTRSDLLEGCCPIHRREPKVIKEKNWFFRLSAYRQQLLDHLDAHPEFVRPVSRRNEVRSYVDKFMEDVSISRESVKWGIPVPDDPQSVVYVWFDALINYISGVGYGTDETKFNKYWPADLQLVGKDIIKFHCALWPAMLLAAGLALPKTVFAHGFFTINGQKMSKSLGNAIDPRDIAKKYGLDPLRFYLLREIPFGEDGDFSQDRLAKRYADDLGNELGNLLHRSLAMTEKYFDGAVPARAEPVAPFGLAWQSYEQGMENYDFAAALDAVWGVCRSLNGYIDDEKPWVLVKTDPARLAQVIYRLLESLRHVAWMLKPIMPAAAEKMLIQLGCAAAEADKTCDAAKSWGGLTEGTKIAKGEPLFPRLETAPKAP